MFPRSRTAALWVLGLAGTAWSIVVRVINAQRTELTVLVGLWLVTYGLWPLIGRPALIVPGAVLLWVGLPTRRGFIHVASSEAPPAARKAG